MKKIKISLQTIEKMLRERRYLFGVLIAAFGMFFLFTAIPVIFIPGNSFLFQINLFTMKEYLFLAGLAMVAGININLQIYAYRQVKVKAVKNSATSTTPSFIAALFGTATCASCLTTILGFLGIGTVITLLKYRWLITGITLTIMLLSLYFTTQKIQGCKSCTEK